MVDSCQTITPQDGLRFSTNLEKTIFSSVYKMKKTFPEECAEKINVWFIIDSCQSFTLRESLWLSTVLGRKCFRIYINLKNNIPRRRKCVYGNLVLPSVLATPQRWVFSFYLSRCSLKIHYFIMLYASRLLQVRFLGIFRFAPLCYLIKAWRNVFIYFSLFSKYFCTPRFTCSAETYIVCTGYSGSKTCRKYFSNECCRETLYGKLLVLSKAV